MIVKMSRYDFVLLSAQSDDFVARLREFGLVDITTTGWEPREQDRQLVSDIEHYRKAIDALMRKGHPYGVIRSVLSRLSCDDAFLEE